MRVAVRHRTSMMPCVLRAFLPRVRAGVGVSIRPTSENPSTSTHWRENTVRCAVRLRPDRGKLCSPVLPSAALDDSRHLGDPAYRSSRRLTPHSYMSAAVDDRQSPIWYSQRPQQLSSCPYGKRVCGTERTGKCSSYDRRHAPPRRGLPAARDCPWWSSRFGACPRSRRCPDTSLSPRGQVPIRGEAAHLGTNLGQYRLRRAPSHTWDRLQSLNCFSERAHPLGDLRTQLLDGLLEEVDVRQLLDQHHPEDLRVGSCVNLLLPSLS